MKKRRLLFISHSSGLAGGGEYDFLSLLKYFSKLKDKYIVHGIFPKGINADTLASYCEKWGYYKWGFIPPHYYYGVFKYFRYLLKYFKQKKDISDFIKNEFYDLCVINVSVTLWPLIYLSSRKFKVVVFIREYIYPTFIRYLVYKIFAKRCTFVITNSRAKKTDYIKISGSHNVDYVYPGVEDFMENSNFDLAALTGNLNHPKILEQNTFKLINIAAINRLKNQKLIVESLHLIKKMKKRVPYVFLIGAFNKDDSYYADLRNYIIKNCLQDYCFFLGELKRNEIYEILRKCNVVIISSVSEGIPLSMIESMKIKKPVISTNVGGIPEIIIDKYNGILIDPNVNSLTEAILELASNELLCDTIAKNAYDTQKQLFDLETNLMKTEQIFDILIN